MTYMDSELVMVLKHHEEFKVFVLVFHTKAGESL